MPSGLSLDVDPTFGVAPYRFRAPAVIPVPAPPESAAVAASPGQLTVTWEASPTDPLLIDAYLVRVRRAGSSDVYLSASYGPEVRSAVLTVPAGTYAVTVAAQADLTLSGDTDALPSPVTVPSTLTGYQVDQILGPGGGATSTVAISPFDPLLMARGTDTSGVTLSHDGFATSFHLHQGILPAASDQVDGLRWSRRVLGRLFFTCGDGNSGGVYVIDNAHTRTPTLPRKLSGRNGNPGLIFCGRNVQGGIGPAATGGGGGGYPRHYGSDGSVVEVDEDTLWAQGATYVWCALPATAGGAISSGVYRLRVQIGPTPGDATAADVAAGDQVKVGGTGTGLGDSYIRCLRFQVSETNPTANDYTRLLIAPYCQPTWVADAPAPAALRYALNDTVRDYDAAGDLRLWKVTTAFTSTNRSTSPPRSDAAHWTVQATDINPQVLVCTNATAATPTAADVSDRLVNVHALSSVKSPSGVWMWVAAKLNAVYVATGQAATGLAFTDLSGGSGPSNRLEWQSVLAWEAAGAYRILLGSWLGGSTNPTNSTNAYSLGTCSPAGGPITWTHPDQGTTPSPVTLDILRDPATWGTYPWHPRNVPLKGGSVAVNGFAVAPSDPTRLLIAARADVFRSDDSGASWYPTRATPSWCPHGVAWGQSTQHADRCGGVDADWGVEISPDGIKTTQPLEPASGIPAGSKWTSNGCFFDPQTGEFFFGANPSSGGTTPPATNANNDLWSITLTQQDTSPRKGLSVATRRNLVTGAAAKGMPLGGVIFYRAGVRTIVVAVRGGQGVHWSKDNGGSWSHDASTAFSTAGGTENAVFILDDARSRVYAFDRDRAEVWRWTISAGGDLTSPTRLASFATSELDTFGVAGYIAHDPVANVLYYSSANNVWAIGSPHTAAANVGGTQLAFQATYPGEQVALIGWVQDGVTWKLLAMTAGYSGASTYLYPRTVGGRTVDGVRALLVEQPATAASWRVGTCVDAFAVEDNGDPAGRQITQPLHAAVSFDGKKVAVLSPCNGAALVRIP